MTQETEDLAAVIRNAVALIPEGETLDEIRATQNMRAMNGQFGVAVIVAGMIEVELTTVTADGIWREYVWARSIDGHTLEPISEHAT